MVKYLYLVVRERSNEDMETMTTDIEGYLLNAEASIGATFLQTLPLHVLMEVSSAFIMRWLYSVLYMEEFKCKNRSSKNEAKMWKFM